jgi:hypothetical protein
LDGLWIPASMRTNSRKAWALLGSSRRN